MTAHSPNHKNNCIVPHTHRHSICYHKNHYIYQITLLINYQRNSCVYLLLSNILEYTPRYIVPCFLQKINTLPKMCSKSIAIQLILC